MSPRSIWNGTICFGLVKVPVKLYSSVDPAGISFREIHVKDGSPLQHRLVCKSEGKQVSRDEIKKGYEISDGKFILLDEEEIKAAGSARSKRIDVEEFVDVAEIDPFYFAKSYYLGVRDVSEPYSLFAAALEQSGKAGIGRFTFHNREYLAAIRSDGSHLILHTLRFADEVVGEDEIQLPGKGKEPSKKETTLARKLVEGMTEDFDPGQFQDEYRAEVMELIERKAAGKNAPKKRARKKKKPDDLSDALERSLAAQGS